MVHGLFGHPKKTWSLNTPNDAPERESADGHLPTETSDESETETPPRKKKHTRGKELFQDVFWPRDLLPKAFPQARIVTWGYDVQIEQLLKSTSQASIIHHSENLLSDLVLLRKPETGKLKPLLFIAHSLGGIVVKDALSLSGYEKAFSDKILPATIGVMFLGTPHHGSKAASLVKTVFEVSKVFFKKPNLQVLRALETNSEILERISRSFGQILSNGRIKVHSFREELPTKGVMIVGPASSTIGYLHETRGSLHANHRTMAKYSSTKDINFQRVVSVLQDWVKESSEKQHSQKNLQDGNEKPALPDGLIFDQELQQCLESLHSFEAQSRFEDVQPAYHETYNWLFDHQVGFEDWLEGKNPSNIYWIQGKPGSGKSTVMKFAIKHPLTRSLLMKYNDNLWVVAGFFFHDRGTTVQKSVEGFLRQVLYQVIDQRKQLFVLIHSIFARILEQHTKDKSRSLPEQWNLSIFREALTLIGRKSTFEVNICLFVDALDEHDGNHRELVLILREIAQLTDNPLFRMRLALAGRPENVFKTAFQSCPGFSIHKYTADDIRLYAEGRIQADMRGTLTTQGDEELSNLVERIVQKAQGVFLWVRLVVNEILEGLCEGDTIEEMETLLSTIPTELEDLYTRALRRSSRNSLQALTRDRHDAYVMFQIASCAREPFLLNEFLVATHFLTTGKDSYLDIQRLSEEQMERRLNSRSAGLLEVPRATTEPARRDRTRPARKAGTGPVQFIHQTVKEFMITGSGGSVIREGLSDRQLESGIGLIFRYILKLFECFGSSAVDLDAQSFVIRNFVYYAGALEWREEQCIADSFEPVILGLSEPLQEEILTEIIRTLIKLPPPRIFVHQHDRTNFSPLYSCLYLPMSLKKSLSTHKSSMKREELYTLWQAASPKGCDVLLTPKVLQILEEEGVVARLLEDGSKYIDDVNNLISVFRGELPVSKPYSVTQERIEMYLAYLSRDLEPKTR